MRCWRRNSMEFRICLKRGCWRTLAFPVSVVEAAHKRAQ